jgi:ABC-type maltose transport system permease subunit
MQIIIVIVILIGLPLLIIVAIESISLKITKRLGKKQNYENYKHLTKKQDFTTFGKTLQNT